jgi:hypothetical protein
MAVSRAARQKQIPSSTPQGHGFGKTSKKRGAEHQFHQSEKMNAANLRHNSIRRASLNMLFGDSTRNPSSLRRRILLSRKG